MWRRVEHWLCGLHGHDALPQWEVGRMWLKCYSCGWESHGWQVEIKQLKRLEPLVREEPGA